MIRGSNSSVIGSKKSYAFRFELHKFRCYSDYENSRLVRVTISFYPCCIFKSSSRLSVSCKPEQIFPICSVHHE